MNRGGISVLDQVTITGDVERNLKRTYTESVRTHCATLKVDVDTAALALTGKKLAELPATKVGDLAVALRYRIGVRSLLQSNANADAVAHGR